MDREGAKNAKRATKETLSGTQEMKEEIMNKKYAFYVSNLCLFMSSSVVHDFQRGSFFVPSSARSAPLR
jgi:hypothetical protein